jgi:flagella basal body P-ring formation protein FlgA
MRLAVQVFLWLAATLAPAFGASALPACRLLEADAIYGRDLAAVVPALAGLPPGVRVGEAPVPGMNRVFTPPELRRVARTHGLDPSGFFESVCFAWPVTPLTAAGIQTALAAALAGRNVQFDVASWNLAPAPSGELVFPLTGLSVLSDKPVIWRGYVVYAGGKHFTTWVNVRVTISETHLVLDAPLRLGEAVAGAALHAELYRGPLPREAAFGDLLQLGNLIARRNLPAGATLTASMFEAPRDVERGDLVAVLVENGAARIETQGVAGQSGRRGEVILVRNPKSGRSYRARIEDKGRVAVVPGGAWGLAGEDSKENKT